MYVHAVGVVVGVGGPVLEDRVLDDAVVVAQGPRAVGVGFDVLVPRIDDPHVVDQQVAGPVVGNDAMVFHPVDRQVGDGSARAGADPEAKVHRAGHAGPLDDHVGPVAGGSTDRPVADPL